MEDGGYRELVERLLTHRIPGRRPRTISIAPGRLPDGAPFANLPLPPGSRLLGSVLHLEDGQRVSAESVLEVPGDPEEILAHFQHSLEALGWPSMEMFGPMRGGFMGMMMGPRANFQQRPGGPALIVAVDELDSGVNDVRLRLDVEMGRQFRPGPRGYPVPPGHDLMPALRPPPGVSIQAQGGGGGGDTWNSQARAQTEKPAAELEAFFARQLEKAGWQRTDGGVSGPVAWSTWKVIPKDPAEGDWQGLLLVLEAFGPGQRSLLLRVESASSPQGFGGWSMSAFSRR